MVAKRPCVRGRWRWPTREVIADHDEISGIDSDVGTRADGQTQIGDHQGGSVIHSVAHHGHGATLSLQTSDDGHLVGRERAGHHLGDAHLRSDSTSRRFVVPGHENAAQPERLELLDGRRRRLSDRVGQRHGSDNGVVVATRAPPCGRAVPMPARRSASAGRYHRLFTVGGDGCLCPTEDVVTLDDAASTESGPAMNDCTAGNGPRSATARAAMATAARGVPTLALARRPNEAGWWDPGRAQRRTAVPSSCPSVTVPVLSSTTVSTCLRRLQRSVALEEDPDAGPLGRRHVQGGRRGQTEGTRAGDDEDGEGGGERLITRSIRAGASAAKVTSAIEDHPRDEDIGDAVGQSLYCGLFILGMLDQPKHLGQLSVTAHLGGPNHQSSIHRDRPPDDGVARRHIEGQGLTSHDAPVHRRLAEDDLAVGGDRLPGPDDEAVADTELARPGVDVSNPVASITPTSLAPTAASATRARFQTAVWTMPRSSDPPAGRS